MAPDPIAASPPIATARRWYAVCIFVLLLSMSFVDRQILSLLAPAVSKYLGISDTQIGVLFGFGFAVVYAFDWPAPGPSNRQAA